MAERYLVVIDMQEDFVDMALGTPEARAIVEGVAARARDFDGRVVFTQDTHGPDYLSTQEGRSLPVEHCVDGTAGWELVPELARLRDERALRSFKKGTFGSLELARFLAEEFEAGRLESVELCGVCTDICVVSNALLIKAHIPEATVRVVSALCAGVTPEKHQAALETMRSCQIVVE